MKNRVFVTYSEVDQGKVFPFLKKLGVEHDDWLLKGRYTIGFSPRPETVAEEMNNCGITLVIATERALNDSTVIEDVELGAAKTPPNVLLVINIEKDLKLGSGGGLSEVVTSSGAEVVGTEDAESAIERVFIQESRAAEIFKQPSGAKGGICDR